MRQLTISNIIEQIKLQINKAGIYQRQELIELLMWIEDRRYEENPLS